MFTNDFEVHFQEANSADFAECETAVADDNAKMFSDSVVAKVTDDSNTVDVFMRMFGMTEAEAVTAVMRQNARVWNTGFNTETVFGGSK